MMSPEYWKKLMSLMPTIVETDQFSTSSNREKYPQLYTQMWQAYGSSSQVCYEFHLTLCDTGICYTLTIPLSTSKSVLQWRGVLYIQNIFLPRMWASWSIHYCTDTSIRRRAASYFIPLGGTACLTSEGRRVHLISGSANCMLVIDVHLAGKICCFSFKIFDILG